jgi:membrane-bound lytic murein transglycosylase D
MPGKVMKFFFCFLCALALLQVHVRAQEVDPAQLIDAADQWLGENIDESVLEALGIDRDRTRQFLTDVKKEFQGEHVLDLASLRDSAKQLLPILQQYEETEPYAVWLKSHLDYFDAAELLRKQAPATKNKTVRPPNPSPQAQRAIWVKVVEEKPVPPAAKGSVERLKQIFREERVPPELVWVAEVESSFDPRAKSPAGAAGLFQLMPATARDLNLSVGLLRDERFHAEKNAHAAARYLRRLYLKFGDWRLALAAYNAGEGRVAELLKKQKAKSFDAIATKLPAETQMYVPKVEAVIYKREKRSLADLKLS